MQPSILLTAYLTNLQILAMNFKGTPGPWYIHDSVSYDRLNERIIGTYDIKSTPTNEQNTLWISDTKPYGVPGFTDKETAHANAKLIAAAPDLLEALRLAIPYIEGAYECAFPDSDENNNVLEAAKTAIAKATS